jgi:hypothetical protein
MARWVREGQSLGIDHGVFADVFVVDLVMQRECCRVNLTGGNWRTQW